MEKAGGWAGLEVEENLNIGKLLPFAVSGDKIVKVPENLKGKGAVWATGCYYPVCIGTRMFCNITLNALALGSPVSQV